MMRFTAIFFALLTCVSARAQKTPTFNTNDFSITSSNLLASNILAGVNMQRDKDSKGRLTFTPLFTIWSNGVAIGTVTNLNFLPGANITLKGTNTSGRVDLEITGAAGGGGGSQTVTNMLQHAGPTNGTVGAMILADGSEITWSTSNDTNRVPSIASALTRDTEWDTEAEVQTAWGGLNILLETEIDASSELAALMDDETGSGLLTFATNPLLTDATNRSVLHLDTATTNWARFRMYETNRAFYTEVRAPLNQTNNFNIHLPTNAPSGAATNLTTTTDGTNVFWKYTEAASGGSSTLLDGSTHTDTAAGTVARGDIIVGNSTPKWSRLAVGDPISWIGSDGVDTKSYAYRNAIIQTDEMTSVGALGALNWQSTANSGSVQGNSGSTIFDTNHFGQFLLSTSTSASSAPTLSLGLNHGYGGGRLIGEWVIRLEDLSTAGEDYAIRIGWSDSTTGTFPVDCAMVMYSHDLNSGNWQLVTGANSVYTTNNTSTAVAADTWYHFRIDGNAAVDQVVLYVNGTSIATNTTNIPNLRSAMARSFAPVFQMVKEAGTTARLMYMDYYGSMFLPTSNRY